MSEPKCDQPDCDQPPMFRYTWPGQAEAWCCFMCAAQLQSVAQAARFPLQMIQLTIDDYTSEEKLR